MKQSTQTLPRLGLVGLAYGGYNLGEELGPAKLDEMRELLAGQPVETVAAGRFVFTEADARAAGEDLARAKVDCILAVITTFVPDHFIVALLDACDTPVFLWCVEREMQCISVVCGPLIAATLYELGKPCAIVAADIPGGVGRALSGAATVETIGAPDPVAAPDKARMEGDHTPARAATLHAAWESLLVFSRAALMRRLLRELRVGYCGGKNEIMFSMSADDYTLKQRFGVTTVTLPIEAFYETADAVSDADAEAAWRGIRCAVGGCTVQEADGVLSARYYLAARRLCEERGLDALSLNCFPHLKSKICLAMAKLNDDGIGAACEGDLHSTVLMHLLSRVSGQAAFNGDWLRMFEDERAVLFSHCGAGAFSLAGCPSYVRLQASIETNDGLAVCYPTAPRGPVTLANLMGARDTFRLAAMRGESLPTDTSYEGTPLKVRFDASPDAMLQRIARCGAGHHWNGVFGDYTRELELLCEWAGVKWTRVG